MGHTTNYQLPTYESSDAPNLTGAYNSAMAKIDTQMKANATAASTAQSDVDSLETRVQALETQGRDFQPSDVDATITVQQLAEAKVTANGIVYYKSS